MPSHEQSVFKNTEKIPDRKRSFTNPAGKAALCKPVYRRPQIIIVDENKAILSDSLTVLDEVMPSAAIRGFIWPQQAIEYARLNPVALAVLDIELGTASGLDLCRTLIEINPRTNVVYLTAFPDYALPAWESKACGFIVKPLTPEKVRLQLEKLRYPISFGSSGGEDL